MSRKQGKHYLKKIKKKLKKQPGGEQAYKHLKNKAKHNKYNLPLVKRLAKSKNALDGLTPTTLQKLLDKFITGNRDRVAAQRTPGTRPFRNLQPDTTEARALGNQRAAEHHYHGGNYGGHPFFPQNRHMIRDEPPRWEEDMDYENTGRPRPMPRDRRRRPPTANDDGDGGRRVDEDMVRQLVAEHARDMMGGDGINADAAIDLIREHAPSVLDARIRRLDDDYQDILAGHRQATAAEIDAINQRLDAEIQQMAMRASDTREAEVSLGEDIARLRQDLEDRVTGVGGTVHDNFVAMLREVDLAKQATDERFKKHAREVTEHVLGRVNKIGADLQPILDLQPDQRFAEFGAALDDMRAQLGTTAANPRSFADKLTDVEARFDEAISGLENSFKVNLKNVNDRLYATDTNLVKRISDLDEPFADVRRRLDALDAQGPQLTGQMQQAIMDFNNRFADLEAAQQRNDSRPDDASGGAVGGAELEKLRMSVIANDVNAANAAKTMRREFQENINQIKNRELTQNKINEDFYTKLGAAEAQLKAIAEINDQATKELRDRMVKSDLSEDSLKTFMTNMIGEVNGAKSRLGVVEERQVGAEQKIGQLALGVDKHETRLAGNDVDISRTRSTLAQYGDQLKELKSQLDAGAGDVAPALMDLISAKTAVLDNQIADLRQTKETHTADIQRLSAAINPAELRELRKEINHFKTVAEQVEAQDWYNPRDDVVELVRADRGALGSLREVGGKARLARMKQKVLDKSKHKEIRAAHQALNDHVGVPKTMPAQPPELMRISGLMDELDSSLMGAARETAELRRQTEFGREDATDDHMPREQDTIDEPEAAPQEPADDVVEDGYVYDDYAAGGARLRKFAGRRTPRADRKAGRRRFFEVRNNKTNKTHYVSEDALPAGGGRYYDNPSTEGIDLNYVGEPGQDLLNHMLQNAGVPADEPVVIERTYEPAAPSLYNTYATYRGMNEELFRPNSVYSQILGELLSESDGAHESAPETYITRHALGSLQPQRRSLAFLHQNAGHSTALIVDPRTKQLALRRGDLTVPLHEGVDGIDLDLNDDGCCDDPLLHRILTVLREQAADRHTIYEQAAAKPNFLVRYKCLRSPCLTSAA